MIREKDLKEIFIRASGPGGQNVNKVSTAVMLQHIPTGLMIKCQEFRTQHQNRVRARELLVETLARRMQERRAAATAMIEKARRQTRKRSKAAKERMLQAKKRHSVRKLARGKVCDE
ncbi:MAG: peptide chain release factor-like protein [Candidatus Omnitrophica bacterium]|nr:peptide chain release factor-like protein [Candidatus Omnitrophota bacterium]